MENADAFYLVMSVCVVRPPVDLYIIVVIRVQYRVPPAPIFHVHWNSDSLLDASWPCYSAAGTILERWHARDMYIFFLLVYRNIFLCIHSTLQYYDHTFSSFIPIYRTQQRLFIESDSVFRGRYAPIIRRLYPNGLS